MIANKKLFISLIKKYNKLCRKEHDSYMKRGSGGRWDWYDTREKLDADIEKVAEKFKTTFCDLITKKAYKSFSLRQYSTPNPEELYKDFTNTKEENI